VIGGENADLHALDLRLFCALHGGKLHREGFQFPQRAGRLGELPLACQRRVAGSFIQCTTGLI